MRAIRAAAAALVCAGLIAAAAFGAGAQEERTYRGVLTSVSSSRVVVGGQPALLTPETLVTSDGRVVSAGSLHQGMTAEVDVDGAGRALEVRVRGVVE